MLKIENVTKSFGDITALENVSFDIDEGEFVFLMGPSGAGKTTIIRLVLRKFLPDEGTIILDEEDITRLPSKKIPKLRQNIGVVFQDYKVLPERTLRENVEVALAVLGLPQKEWDARVDNVLELVGLIERDGLFPSQLSGGELQRVAVARALVVNPKILIADEPTGNLDWDTADELMKLFEKINEEGKTVIMATHHQGIVDKLGKRVVELKKGKIVADDGVKQTSEKKSGGKKDKKDEDDKDKKDDSEKEKEEK